MNPNLEIACTDMATTIMFIGGAPYNELLAKHSVQYRKGKCSEDIKKAINLGLKNGMAKTEMEISMIALYLSKVVKLA